MGLDGNVHFIGTQGVGKSTLLRAILFFYNADKMKLGIPREKKRFDEYYFPYQNSYIIYEVSRDNVPYCVIAFKKNGRVAFRFIDAAYDKSFFIDEGRSFDNWDQTRAVLGKNIRYSSIITSYEEYRKIIYGDNKGLKSEFKKYAIVESNQFQNIPRTIQNVLLNSNLESKFIKDTIINSLNEEEIGIDLTNYSNNHLKGFESRINDIKIWHTRNKRGQVLIKNQADKIIDLKRILNFLEREQRTLGKDLSIRMGFVNKEKPILSLKLAEEEKRMFDFGKQIKNLANLHQVREQKLHSNIELKKSDLQRSKEKQKQYKNIGISKIIEKISLKKGLQNDEKAKREEKHALTTEFGELKQKYQVLISQESNQLDTFKNQKGEERNTIQNSFSKARETVVEKYTDLIKLTEKTFDEQLENVGNELNDIKEKEYLQKQKGVEAKHKQFYQSEIKETTEKAREITVALNESNGIIKIAKNEIKTIKKEWEYEEKSLLKSYQEKQEKLHLAANEKSKSAEEIKTNLANNKSSLFGWLTDNVSNWEATIGKVIDEKEILFNSNLQPKLSQEKAQNTFYGVELNMDAIDKHVKTAEEYENELAEIEVDLINLKKQQQKLTEEQELEKQKLNKKFKKKLSIEKELISQNEYKIDQLIIQEKSNIINGDEWLRKAVTEKKQVLNEVEKQLELLAVSKQNITEKIDKIKAEIKRKTNTKLKQKQQELDVLEKSKTEQLNTILASISERKKQTESRLTELKARENGELKSKGADTARLTEIDAHLNRFEKDLQYIDENEHQVIEYNKDKREYFDQAVGWKTDLETLEKKKSQIQKVHLQEKQKTDEKYYNQKKIKDSLTSELQVLQNDLAAFDTFKTSSTFTKIEPDFIPYDGELKVENTAQVIIRQITDKYHAHITKINDLRTAINLFSGQFSAQNIFSFKTQFILDNDYLTFADELKEFIEEDKVNEFSKRVNEQFANIVRQIGKETGELLSKEAEIEKVIRKINADFENKNFVGAIKSMQMRTEASSNKVVKVLSQIRTFNEENTFALGTVDLFSDSDNTAKKNEKAVDLLKVLIRELENYKKTKLTLSESFDLQFKIVENDNDSGWVEKLANVGSEGTDVLVKAMINILLLNVFKESASKKFKDFKLHCMLDEVGRLHPNNVKGILRFANDRNILLINGSPTSYNATHYKYTYNLSKVPSKTDQKKYVTKISRLIKMTKPIAN